MQTVTMILSPVYLVCVTLCFNIHMTTCKSNTSAIIGFIQDQENVNVSLVDHVITQWNADHTVQLSYTSLNYTAQLTDIDLLKFVSHLVCSGTVVLVTASPCDVRLIRSLLLSRIPVLVLNPEPICFPGTLDYSEVILSRPFWSVSDVITTLVDPRYQKVVLVHDQHSDRHLMSVMSALEDHLMQASVISRMSIKNDVKLAASQILNDLEKSEQDSNEHKPNVMYVLWTEVSTVKQVLQQIKKSVVSENSPWCYWLVVCSDELCLNSIESDLKEVMLPNFVVMVIEKNKLSVNVSEQIQNVITSLAQRIETISADVSLFDDDESPCQRLKPSFIADILKPVLTSQAAEKTCEHYELYLGNNDLVTPELEDLRFCDNNVLNDDIRLFPEQGLAGKHLQITTIESAPFVTENVDENGQSYFQGTAIEMLVELAKTLNFTYTLRRVSDGQFGALQDDGNWSGMVGQLQRKEVDLSVASLSVTDTRKTVIDFVDYYFEYGAAVMIKPSEDENKWRVILQPFRWRVWLCLVFSVPFAGIVAWIISILVYKIINGDRDDFIDPKNSTWYTFGALLTQGGTYLPRSASGRTFICSWWFFSIIVVATYGGSLIAYLTINKIDAPFDDLDGLVKQERYKWGFKEGTVYHSTFKNATGGVFKDLWLGAQAFAQEDPSVFSKSTAEHLDKVDGGDYVFIMDRTPLVVRVISDESCSLVMLAETFMPLPFGIGLQKESPYKQEISKAVNKLRQSGLIQYWEKKWWPKQSCSGIPKPEAHKVSLMDTQSAFYLLLAGVVAAGVVLCTEQIRRHAKKLKVKKLKVHNVKQNGGRLGTENGRIYHVAGIVPGETNIWEDHSRPGHHT